MNADTLTRFADLMVDDLTERPDTAPADPLDAAQNRSLADLLTDSRPGVDDAEVLAVLVVAVRLRNIADNLIAGTVAAAERLSIPARKHLKNGANLLIEIGVAPAVAYRAARVGRSISSTPTVARALRDGAIGIEFADAIGKGLTHITDRVTLDDDQRASIVTNLMVQTTPAEVAARAREIAIALAPDEVEEGSVPVAEDYDLNEMTVVQNDEGRITVTADLDVVTGEELDAALDPLCRPVPLPDGTPDPRTDRRRRADALGQIIRTYLAGSQRPTSGGVLPHVTLIRPAMLPELVEGSTEGSVPMLGFTGPISAATADLIACDAVHADVVVDEHGAPLDVGRSQRLFPPKIRRALHVRDGGCAFPGCGRPASWCDAHHMTSWADGGATSCDNGVLLCRMHHTLIHHTGWEVFLGHDRHPWFYAPADPAHPNWQREPIRSHGRRTLTTLPGAA
ncbi:MAG: DUF222 domain-containing protein [Gordonia sp. (in: high G+C Gram-positive bacteria)]